MTWFGEQENRKWFHRIRNAMKRMKSVPTDEFDTDFIDLDQLLDMYIDEFQSKKK
jgi:hypothetical protein